MSSTLKGWIPTDDEGTPEVSPEDALTVAALAEIAKAFTGVDMASMPYVPPTAPCRLPDANPNDWFDPFLNFDFLTVNPIYIDEIADELCEGCVILNECLEWALDNPRQGGILGGTTAKLRDEIRRARGDQPTTDDDSQPAA